MTICNQNQIVTKFDRDKHPNVKTLNNVIRLSNVCNTLVGHKTVPRRFELDMHYDEHVPALFQIIYLIF